MKNELIFFAYNDCICYYYDAYGMLLIKDGDTDNSYMYVGEEYNANTGLYYLRARYMNPSTGTFTTMDSYQGSLYEPISLHKYAYANANPVTKKWGLDKNGKSHPVEWKADNGAEVNIDIGHSQSSQAPTIPHIGYQTGGKRGQGGAVRGHIFIYEVHYNR